MSKLLADLRALADAAAIRGDRDLAVFIHARLMRSEVIVGKIAEINERLDRLGAPRFAEVEPVPKVHFNA